MVHILHKVSSCKNEKDEIFFQQICEHVSQLFYPSSLIELPQHSLSFNNCRWERSPLLVSLRWCSISLLTIVAQIFYRHGSLLPLSQSKATP